MLSRVEWQEQSRLKRFWDVLVGKVPEEEWRTWPLARQRGYLGLSEGENPPAPERLSILPPGVTWKPMVPSGADTMNDLDLAEKTIDCELETLELFCRTSKSPFASRVKGLLAAKRVFMKLRESHGDTRVEQAARYIPKAIPHIFTTL